MGNLEMKAQHCSRGAKRSAADVLVCQQMALGVERSGAETAATFCEPQQLPGQPQQWCWQHLEN